MTTAHVLHPRPALAAPATGFAPRLQMLDEAVIVLAHGGKTHGRDPMPYVVGAALLAGPGRL